MFKPVSKRYLFDNESFRRLHCQKWSRGELSLFDTLNLTSTQARSYCEVGRRYVVATAVYVA